MEFDELLAFASHVHLALRKRNSDHSPLEQTYAEMIKISEEVGELSDLILSRAGNQRQEKLSSGSDEKIAEEMADVILTVFVLAANLGIDLPKAIEEKVAIVKERFDMGHV